MLHIHTHTQVSDNKSLEYENAIADIAIFREKMANNTKMSDKAKVKHMQGSGSQQTV